MIDILVHALAAMILINTFTKYVMQDIDSPARVLDEKEGVSISLDVIFAILTFLVVGPSVGLLLWVVYIGMKLSPLYRGGLSDEVRAQLSMTFDWIAETRWMKWARIMVD